MHKPSIKSAREYYKETAQARRNALLVLLLLTSLTGLQFVHHKFFMNGSMIQQHISSGILSAIPLLIALALYLVWRHTAEREREARYQVQTLEKHREDMTHMLVHDLKNPLSAALTGLAFVIDQPEFYDRLGNSEKKALNLARKGQKQLARMIEDILDVSQAEAGEMPLNLELVDLAEIIKPVVEELSARQKATDLSISVDLGDGTPTLVDTEKIRRVVGNLLDNALKHTPRGGSIDIAVEISQEQTQVSISDTGEGIPEDLQKRIFDKFVQSEAARQGRKMSVGLGLAFCKLALEAHGGRIWVESKPGEGSTFTFTLPRDSAKTTLGD